MLLIEYDENSFRLIFHLHIVPNLFYLVAPKNHQYKD